MSTDNDRYVRHHRMPGWNQDRLASATVVIMGVGALGNEVAQGLALAGVGHLILCDPDRIERSNLSRAPLFREHDIGRLKVEAAATALADLAPDIRVEGRARRLRSGVGLGELRDADLVIGCLDSRAARFDLTARCGLVRAPWLDGATGPWDGEIRPYLDPDGPCFACNRSPAERAETDIPASCALVTQGPAAAAARPVSAVVGAHMTLAATRFLMGLPVPGNILLLNGTKGTVESLSQHRDNDCPFHKPLPETIPRIAVGPGHTVGDLLHAVGADGEPLAWEPVPVRAICRTCGTSEEIGEKRPQAFCPTCDGQATLRTVLELSRIPDRILLSEILIPSRETLAVRTWKGVSFVELAA